MSTFIAVMKHAQEQIAKGARCIPVFRARGKSRAHEYMHCYSCEVCSKTVPAVIKADGKLNCIRCRTNQVGISALDEPIYFE